MSESRIAAFFSRSTILTVGRLVAFIAVGFGVGLVFGVATEEPELLAGHVRGESELVTLADVQAADAAEAAEAVAAAEAARRAEEAEERAQAALAYEASEAFDDGGADDAPRDESTIALPDVAAAPPPGSSGWAIQVGAFGDAPSAEQLADRLEGKGYPVQVLPAGPESNRWRVRVQPIADEPAARSTAEKIERDERLPTWVIRLEGPTRS